MTIEIHKQLKKFVPHFQAAKAAELNEADTVQRINKFFSDVLGYDALDDISMEAAMKGRFVDIVLKVDGKVRVAVEAKAAHVELQMKHTEQAQYYGSKNKIPWVILTNGSHWHLYRVILDEDGLDAELLFHVDLSRDADFDLNAQYLALLHHDAIKKGSLEGFYERHKATTPQAIVRALFHEDVLSALRKQLRKNQETFVPIEDLAISLRKMLSAEIREEVGRIKVKKRAVKKESPMQAKGTVETSLPEAAKEPVMEAVTAILPAPGALAEEMIQTLDRSSTESKSDPGGQPAD